MDVIITIFAHVPVTTYTPIYLIRCIAGIAYWHPYCVILLV